MSEKKESSKRYEVLMVGSNRIASIGMPALIVNFGDIIDESKLSKIAIADLLRKKRIKEIK